VSSVRNPWPKMNWPLCAAIAFLLCIAQPARTQSQTAVQELIDELPACSLLRVGLERGVYGTGTDEAYMAVMRQQGVERALFAVQAVLGRTDRPLDLRIIRQLYFRQFDKAESQMTDEVSLKAIEASGLATQLEKLSRDRVLTAPFVRGHPTRSKKIGSVVEFFANPWLPERKPVLTRSGSPTPLTEAILLQDIMETRALLASHRFAKNELNLALFEAVRGRYDNSAVIKLLLDAGADVNAEASDGTTPLMNAIDTPCNLIPLLDAEANVNARDKWGRSALDLARREQREAAIRLLQRDRFQNSH